MRHMVHSLGVKAGAVPSEGGTQSAEIKVMAYHVHELHASSVLGEAILVLTFWDAHQMLDVEVGEELFESGAGALRGAVCIEHAKALRARASSEVVIHSRSVDAILLVTFDRVEDAADRGVGKGVRVDDELLHYLGKV